MDGVNYRAARERHERGVDRDYVREVLSDFADGGITYLRDGGDDLGVGEYAKHVAPEYGIEYRTPIFALHKRGLYGSVVGREFDSIAEFRELLALQKRKGADFVKLMISGIMDFSVYGKIDGGFMSSEDIKTYVALAKDAGFAVMVHANTDAVVIPAIEAGVDSIEHGYYLGEEALSAIAESGAVWVPTFAAIANLLSAPPHGADSDVVARIVKDQMKNVARAANLGARLAIGSDSGAYGCPHVTATRDEANLMRSALGSERSDGITNIGNELIKRKFRR